jgi:hypothetical protein
MHMKQIQKITAVYLVAILLLAAGCIKDRGVTAPTKQQPPSSFTIDFPNQVETAGLDIVPGQTIYTFNVELNAATGIYPAGTVTITKNAAAVAPHTFLPDSAFFLVSPTVTVDPVTHYAAFQLSITTTKINLSGDFAVAYTITSTTTGATIATNKKDIIIFVGAKNRWDGVYAYVSGFVQRYSAPGAPICCDGLTGPLGPGNPNIDLVTVNGTDIKFQPHGAVSTLPGLTWTTSAGSLVAGIDGLTATMDPATNNVASIQSTLNLTLSKWAGFGGPPGPTGPPPVNTYDPATKTVHFGFRWNPSANIREYELILQYVGPR